MKYVKRIEINMDVVKVLKIPTEKELGRPVEISDLVFNEQISWVDKSFAEERLRLTEHGIFQVVNYLEEYDTEHNTQIYEGDYILMYPNYKIERVPPYSFDGYYFKERTTPEMTV